MTEHNVQSCPECGNKAQYQPGIGWNPDGVSPLEIVSNVQMSAEQIKELRKQKSQIDTERQKMVDDMMANDKDLERAIQQTSRALIGMMLDGADEITRKTSEPDAKFMVARNNLRVMLNRLKSTLEAEWLDEQRSGKVCIRDVIYAQTPQSQLKVFHKYLPDDVDETGIDVVGLIDQSTSMGYMMDHASQVMWSIASAVRLTGNASSIIGFSDDAEILVGRKQKLPVSEYFPFGLKGGTYPLPALQLAEQTLSDSTMPNRLLFVVTDGEWAGEYECSNLIQKIAKDYDADTLLVNLGYESSNKRGCKYVVNAHDVDDMCAQLSKVIIDISQRCARRIAAETGRDF
jgi:hypothetical protein